MKTLIGKMPLIIVYKYHIRLTTWHENCRSAILNFHFCMARCKNGVNSLDGFWKINGFADDGPTDNGQWRHETLPVELGLQAVIQT